MRLFTWYHNIQNNCVFSYRNMIRRDKLTIYHWAKNERSYTIEFRRAVDGRYVIEQMLQANNRLANQEDLDYVKSCLGSRLGSRSESIVENDLGLFGAFENYEDAELPF